MTDPRTVTLAPWHGTWPADDPDANFKHEMSLYTQLDPLRTIGNLARSLDVPAGAVCHYVLAKWASAGAEALLELGPTAINRMTETIAAAESEGTDTARLAAYNDLCAQLSWLRVPLDEPEAYPDPGAQT